MRKHLNDTGHESVASKPFKNLVKPPGIQSSSFPVSKLINQCIRQQISAQENSDSDQTDHSAL